MTQMNDPKPKGYARVEFLAVRARILEMQSAGHSNKYIYQELAADGSISMSYRMFCRYAGGNGRSVLPSTSRPSLASAKTAKKLSADPISSEFKFDPVVTHEDEDDLM